MPPSQVLPQVFEFPEGRSVRPLRKQVDKRLGRTAGEELVDKVGRVAESIDHVGLDAGQDSVYPHLVGLVPHCRLLGIKAEEDVVETLRGGKVFRRQI